MHLDHMSDELRPRPLPCALDASLGRDWLEVCDPALHLTKGTGIGMLFHAVIGHGHAALLVPTGEGEGVDLGECAEREGGDQGERLVQAESAHGAVFGRAQLLMAWVAEGMPARVRGPREEG